MNLETALRQRSRVEAFQRRHRVGLVTLLFSDVVGSTRLKQDLGDQRALELLERHNDLVRELLATFNEAEEISTAGDSFFLVFSRPSDGVRFALRLQRSLRDLAKQTKHEVAVRIGLHVGEVVIAEGGGKGAAKDLYGMQVDICARVSALAQGRQILMTRFAFDSARQVLKGQQLDGLRSLVWMNHGRYQLKGVEEPLEVCAVGEQNGLAGTRPGNTEKGRRFENFEEEPVLGWRPAMEQVVPQTRWVLEKMLGEGGFGEVWLARHQVLGERCVFKFCFRADRARSLRREATLFRVMKERFGANPRIVGVRDVFFDEPPYYLMMEYSDGSDLRTWCDEHGGVSQVPLPVRLEIVAQVAEALQAAHDAGVVHRDIKPANILVSGKGAGADRVQVKLTDFGIGQIVSQEVLAGLSKGDFTQSLGPSGATALTGTHLYMAPELVAGRAASAASDVYSLGVLLYQMLVGDFTAPLTMDWTEEIKEPTLRKALMRCFAGNPAQRFARVSQLAEVLRAPAPAPAPAAPVAPVSAAPPSPRPATGGQFQAVDLARFYNAALTQDWCNQVGHNLAALRKAPRLRAGILEFEVKGILQVGCFQLEKLKAAYPPRVGGMVLPRGIARLHFLQATLGREADGAKVGRYVVRYADGREQEIPLIYGEDVRSWLVESDPIRELKRASVVWAGRTVGLFLRSIRLFKMTWDNPIAGEPVSLDFEALPGEAAPFLLALTAESGM